ncbi:unnamed protein product [Penicillium camemberti]|uniref:Str. FM013 n=1 Tax=Penicillium camemberti (strain FM 013) TaxID=1429867 RepID=A0A0G4PD15_PENC3|nr:unnamed protein product [Penicillium camemberti]
MTDKSVISTAHRALALPEIVGEILFLIYQYPARTWYRTRWLLNFALVNKTWCNEALRILWGDMDAHEEPLDEVMINISPDRRQIYANFVKTATVTTYSQETESVVQPALENVVFPQIHTLRLVLVFHNMDTEKGIRIPILNMPNLQILHVDHSTDLTYLYPDQWDYLADRIPKLFPTLLDLRVEIPAILYLTGFETLSENMPHLESLEFAELLGLSDVEDTSNEDTDDDDLDDEDAHS